MSYHPSQLGFMHDSCTPSSIRYSALLRGVTVRLGFPLGSAQRLIKRSVELRKAGGTQKYVRPCER